jgi:hypothetical protein
LGLGIQNDVQAATHLRENGYGHHLVLSRTLLYIIFHAVKGGSCGGVDDYRVEEAQTELDILREAPEQDQEAIKAAMKKLELAIAARDLTSEGKSKGGIKGGSCGGDKDYRVVDAQARFEPAHSWLLHIFVRQERWTNPASVPRHAQSRLNG